MGLAVLLTAAVSFFGLRAVADGLDEPSGESGHSHGEGTETSDEHATTEESPAPNTESAEPDTSASTDTEADHTEDGHSH